MPLRISYHDAKMFQFLIGILKTKVAPGAHGVYVIWFQFLIGILKTIIFPLVIWYNDKFQFLIGILKTRWGYRQWWINSQFQFLIGILKTHAFAFSDMSFSPVSIPYRYSKNSLYRLYNYSGRRCFNSL